MFSRLYVALSIVEPIVLGYGKELESYIAWHNEYEQNLISKLDPVSIDCI